MTAKIVDLGAERLEDGEDRHLVALIWKRREVIERVALAAPRTWAEARAAMKKRVGEAQDAAQKRASRAA
jgi:hypothetical protein